MSQRTREKWYLVRTGCTPVSNFITFLLNQSFYIQHENKANGKYGQWTGQI